jgi:hypothetical protein
MKSNNDKTHSEQQTLRRGSRVRKTVSAYSPGDTREEIKRKPKQTHKQTSTLNTDNIDTPNVAKRNQHIQEIDMGDKEAANDENTTIQNRKSRRIKAKVLPMAFRAKQNIHNDSENSDGISTKPDPSCSDSSSESSSESSSSNSSSSDSSSLNLSSSDSSSSESEEETGYIINPVKRKFAESKNTKKKGITKKKPPKNSRNRNTKHVGARLNAERNEYEKKWRKNRKDLYHVAKKKLEDSKSLTTLEKKAFDAVEKQKEQKKQYKKRANENLKRKCESGDVDALAKKKELSKKQQEYNKRYRERRDKRLVEEALKRAHLPATTTNSKENDVNDKEKNQSYGKIQYLSFSNETGVEYYRQESCTFERHRHKYCQNVKAFKLHFSGCNCNATNDFFQDTSSIDVSGIFLFPKIRNARNCYVAVINSEEEHDQLEIETDIVKNVIKNCEDSSVTFSAAQCILSNVEKGEPNGMMCIGSINNQSVESIVAMQRSNVTYKKNNNMDFHHDHVDYTYALKIKKLLEWIRNGGESNKDNKTLSIVVYNIISLYYPAGKKDISKASLVDIKVGHHLIDAVTGSGKDFLHENHWLWVTVSIKQNKNRFDWKLDIPGGKRKLGEAAFDCARRETDEETSVAIDDSITSEHVATNQENRYFYMSAEKVLELEDQE